MSHQRNVQVGNESWPGTAHTNRRQFLKFLAGSPVLASMGWHAWLAANSPAAIHAAEVAAALDKIITSPDLALNVFDFEAAAQAALPPAHWGYLATGVVDDGTLQANRKAFSKYHVRPRRLIDVRNIDLSTELFGVKWDSPIMLAPVGSQKAFHEEGEVAAAKAAAHARHLQILSTQTTCSVEDVNEARGEPVWYQLYPTSRWEVTQGLVKRARAAGCPVLVVTVDQITFAQAETFRRWVRQDTRDCSECHSPRVFGRHKPMYRDLNTAGLTSNLSQSLTWDLVKRLRDATDQKLVLKGIVTREDAHLCLEHGVDGILVSNHGGRAEDSGWGTLDSLPEVVEAAGGKIPVMIDGGFRRGTDIFKALALGAKAVAIGRPYIWGLASFGQPGVERVLSLLRLELELAMKHAGTRSLREIDAASIGKT